jgi:ferredoxin-type protein NapH
MVTEIIAEILRLIIAVGLIIAGILGITIWIRDPTRKISYLRFYVQAVSVIAIFLALPLLAQWPSVVLGVIVFVTIIFGRFFCGWICPFGLYMDFITQVRKSFKIGYWNLSEKLNSHLHKLRYLIVVTVLTLPFFLGPLDINTWISFVFFLGPFKPLIVFFLGPLEPLIIPWTGPVSFNGYSLSYPYIREIIAFSNGPFLIAFNVLIFVAFTIVTSFMVRRFWCRFCPTGVSIAIVNHFAPFKWAPVMHLNKVEEKCTKCGICKRVCPLQVTEVYDQKGGDITTSMCMLCLRCVEMCPYESCLKANFNGKTFFKSRNWLKK